DDEVDGLDVAGSIEDFEAQISKAAEDLARDSRAQSVQAMAAKAPPAPKAEPAKPAPRPAQATAAPKLAETKSTSDLRPVEPAPAAAPATFAHANDDRQKDFRSLQQLLRRNPSSAIYWMVSLVSIAWVAGGLILGHMLFAPAIWEIRSLQQLLA